jgi:hypothetical protein
LPAVPTPPAASSLSDRAPGVITMTLIRIAVAACAVAAMLALPSSGGEVTWDGSCPDNNWHTCCDLGGGVFENNWDFGPGPQCPLPLPGPEDDVDAGQEPVLLNQSPEEIKSLISGGEFSIGGVDLTVTQGAFLSAFNLSGGGLHAGGSVVVSGPLHWTAGQLSHLGGPPVYTEMRGPITLSGGGHVLRGRQVVCTGAVAWIGGALTLAEGTTFDNQSTFTVRCDQAVDGSDGAVFLNSRTFTKQETTGETRFLSGAAFHNGPTANVNVETGTLRFEGGGRNEGGLSVFDDAVLRFKSGSFGFLTDTSVQGPGLFWVDGAVVELLDETRLSMEKLRVTGGQLLGPGTIAAADMDWVSGTVGGGGQTFADRLTMSGAVTRVLSDHELVSNGNATWTGTAPLVMLTGSAFSNNGRMTLSAGLKRVTMSDGAEWINERGSTLDILANVDFGFGGAGGKVTNSEATMNVGPGSTLCEFQSNVPFEQFGTLNLRSGTMLVRGGESLSGLFDLSAGTVFQLQSKPFAVEGATFQGEGLLRVGLGGTLEARGGTTTAPKVELAAGSAGVSGDGDLEVTGVLDWLQGSMTGTGKTISKTTLNIDGLANLTINQRTLRNEGDVVWSSGNLVLDAGARFENAPGGVVDMDAPHDFLHNTGNEGVVHNEGILRKLIDPTLLVFPSGVRLVNRDVVSLGKGDIRIAGPSTSSGLYAIAPGSTVEFSGFANTLEAGTRFQGIGRALVGGSMQVTGADVTAQTLELAGDVEGPGTITVSDSLRWTRGTMRHAGATRNDGTMTIDNANDVVIDTRTLLNTGTAAFVGSRDMLLRNGGTVNNQGTFDLRNDRTQLLRRRPDHQFGHASQVRRGRRCDAANHGIVPEQRSGGGCGGKPGPVDRVQHRRFRDRRPVRRSVYWFELHVKSRRRHPRRG